MKIIVQMDSDELDAILGSQQNCSRSETDVRINIIDALDNVLDLPNYDVVIEVQQ